MNCIKEHVGEVCHSQIGLRSGAGVRYEPPHLSSLQRKEHRNSESYQAIDIFRLSGFFVVISIVFEHLHEQICYHGVQVLYWTDLTLSVCEIPVVTGPNPQWLHKALSEWLLMDTLNTLSLIHHFILKCVYMFCFKRERKLRHKRIIFKRGSAIMVHTISQFSQKELNAYDTNSLHVDTPEDME